MLGSHCFDKKKINNNKGIKKEYKTGLMIGVEDLKV